MKILPTMASAMSGSLRGITASHNRGGAYFRGRTVPTNPNTNLQSQVRTAFGTLSQDWNSLLTPEQREGWNNYAQQVSWTDSLGQTIQLSGINHFVRSNTVLLQLNAVAGVGLTVIEDAPPQNDLGITPVLENVSLNHATGPPNTLSLDFTIANNAMYTDGVDYVIFWLSGQKNPGILSNAGPYVLSGFDNDFTVAAGTFELFDAVTPGAAWQARWGSPQVGMRIFGYARALLQDGRLSGKVPFDAGLVPAAT